MKKYLKSYAIVALGSVIFALAFDWFFAPNQVAMGGITGLAQVINALVPWLSVGVLAFVLNVPLFLAGWKYIGFHLLASSLFSMLVSSVAIDAIALIESGLGETCGAIVGILAPRELRIRRIMAREGISEDYARKRVEAQQGDGFFRTHCDYLLENRADDTPEAFQARAKQLFEQILSNRN